MKYRRILLKLSGEVLMGNQPYGIDLDTVGRLADEVLACAATGAQLALVIGGGNIFRGLAGAAKGMDRVAADHMGIMATVMNALAMQGVLMRKGMDARVLSAIAMPTVCETYSRAKGIYHLEAGRVIICAAGTGLPFFTTDTGAALRAAELGCGALFKGTSVDGVYSADPRKDKDAKKYETITYDEVLSKSLAVADAAAFSLCRENKLPIIVFDLMQKGNIAKAVRGEKIGTLVN